MVEFNFRVRFEDWVVTHLVDYGWSDFFSRQLDVAVGEGVGDVARVVQEHKGAYLVRGVGGDVWAEISGRMRHEGAVRADFPAVGDWVVLRRGEGRRQKAEGRGRGETQEAEGGVAVGRGVEGPVQIARVLGRRTVLVRRLEADEQILATNIDYVFLGTSLNENFNLRRLERYLTLARESGARPVVLLTKADLCADAGPYLEEVRSVAGDAGIHTISVVSGEGMEEVRKYLTPGMTSVILGSSGIGKSTLVNYLAEADVQDMMEAREFDDKGRHCTTFRHLVRTKSGGLIIDTPGLRGLSVGEATDALISTFKDVDVIAARCKFTNCGHESEPGCAVKAAIEGGTLDEARFMSYLKLKREVGAMGERENRIADRKQKKLRKKAKVSGEKKAKEGWDRHYR